LNSSKVSLIDPEFRAALQYKKDRKKANVDNIEDILDGRAYRKFQFLEEDWNLSFVFNTDGVAVFKAGGQQLWPIYAVINELPPSIRFFLISFSVFFSQFFFSLFFVKFKKKKKKKKVQRKQSSFAWPLVW